MVGTNTIRQNYSREGGLDYVVANGGSFSNGLPVSLSMGCGTWGRNNFSDNLNVRHYMNITRVAFTIPEHVPSVDDLLGAYFARWGK